MIRRLDGMLSWLAVDNTIDISKVEVKATAIAWRCLLVVGSLALTACGGGGGGSGKANSSTDSVSPPASPPPTLSFSASANSVSSGTSVTLTWQSSNTDSCRASGGWTGDRPTSGSESVGPLQQSQSFALSCSGQGGGALREVTVEVNQSSGVSVSLRSDPPSVLIGSQVELSWNSINADSCEAGGSWTGARSLSGTFTTPALTADTTFTLTCFAQGDSAVAMVTVDVVDKIIRWQAPTENVDGTALTNLAGFNVYWGDGSRDYTGSINLPADAREWDISLSSGTYFLAVTAVDGQDSESSYSNEIRKTIP